MTVKDLKQYLTQFKDTDTVALSAWFADGARTFLPNLPPALVYVHKKQRYAVVGHFDNCLGHQLLAKPVDGQDQGGIRVVQLR